ncbi:MAG: alkaline phosphatase family protein [Gammaproteobacteria bacterium]
MSRVRAGRLRCACVLAVAAALAAAPAAHAYVGPGAGFALVGSLFAVLGALAAGAIAMLLWPARALVRWARRRRSGRRARVRRVVVLGLDGLDPALAQRWIEAGELPELAGLAREGTFSRLRTTYPAISPVAWSSFMTGVDPTRHNVFDFLNRDLRTYKPRLSSSEIGPAPRSVRVGDWIIPLGRPLLRGMRRSRAFWSILGDHGVSCNILRVPLTFPPERFAGMLLSAMCVPDLRGSQGSFTYYTTEPGEAGEGNAAPETTGGERHLVRADDDGVIRAELTGPENPLRAGAPRMSVPFTVRLMPAERACELEIAGQRIRMAEREYSPWLRIAFKAGLGVYVYGIARFYVTRFAPSFGLYVTPINIDPERPALPISWPAYYSVYLAKLIGEFATLGLAEDTWALNEEVIDEDAFLKQTLDHHAERERMFENALEKTRSGVVACVFDGTDRLQHMFYRFLDDTHPANRGKDVARYRDTILEMYRRVDALVGRVRRRMGPDEMLLVISDHGFQSFRRGVNLNAWLRDAGLLHLREDEQGGDWFAGVDWSRTRAYAFGLGGIYLNLRGREAQGIVEPGAEAEALKARLAGELSGLLDPQSGTVAINSMFDRDRVHSPGPYRDNGPDLIVGYNAGYRASWEGAVGRAGGEVFTDNTKAWSGDHCIDPRLVPGVLFSNWSFAEEDPGIMDLAPTLLDLFGVPIPGHMTGACLQPRAPAPAAEA